ncbi:MAG: hypothetical protein ABIQ06_12935 [Caldimonas sp.]
MPSKLTSSAVATAAALLAVSGAAAAQTPAPPPPACQSAEHRQFDFWLGEWEVFLASGKKAGDSRIESISAGCALLENWSGNGGFSGKSLNSYDSSDKLWHQSWVDSSGTRLELAGSWADKRMLLSSGSGAAMQRIAWSVNDDGSVRQLWESTTDGGKSWTVQFDGKYVRRK